MSLGELPMQEWFGLAITIGNSSTDLILREGENTTDAAVSRGGGWRGQAGEDTWLPFACARGAGGAGGAGGR